MLGKDEMNVFSASDCSSGHLARKNLTHKPELLDNMSYMASDK